MTTSTVSDVDQAVIDAERDKAAAEAALAALEAKAGSPDVTPDQHHKASDRLRFAAAALKNAFAGRDARDAKARSQQYAAFAADAADFAAHSNNTVQTKFDQAVTILEELFAAAEQRDADLRLLLDRNAEIWQVAAQHDETGQLHELGIPATHYPRDGGLVVTGPDGAPIELRSEPSNAVTALVLKVVAARNGGYWPDEYNVRVSTGVATQFGLPHPQRR